MLAASLFYTLFRTALKLAKTASSAIQASDFYKGWNMQQELPKQMFYLKINLEDLCLSFVTRPNLAYVDH